MEPSHKKETTLPKLSTAQHRRLLLTYAEGYLLFGSYPSSVRSRQFFHAVGNKKRGDGGEKEGKEGGKKKEKKRKRGKE